LFLKFFKIKFLIHIVLNELY